jgi:hypothetical protein
MEKTAKQLRLILDKVQLKSYMKAMRGEGRVRTDNYGIEWFQYVENRDLSETEKKREISYVSGATPQQIPMVLKRQTRISTTTNKAFTKRHARVKINKTNEFQMLAHLLFLEL